jgi:hypothetical protein
MAHQIRTIFFFTILALLGIFTGWLLASPERRLCGVLILIIWGYILFFNFLINTFRYARFKHLIFAVSIIVGIILGIL